METLPRFGGACRARREEAIMGRERRGGGDMILARRDLRRALDKRMGDCGRPAIRKDCDMAFYGVIVIGDFLEGEAEVEADTPLAAAKSAVAEILEDEGDLTEMGKFWLRLEAVRLSEPGEDFRWLWDDERAAAAAEGNAFAFQALVDCGDVSRDDQWSEALVRGARSAGGANA